MWRRRRHDPDDGGPQHTADDGPDLSQADGPPDVATGNDVADTADDGPAHEEDEQLLTTPLDDGDLAGRLEAAGRRGPARSTLVLAAIALLIFGFAAGVTVGRAVATFEAEVTGTAAANTPR